MCELMNQMLLRMYFNPQTSKLFHSEFIHSRFCEGESGGTALMQASDVLSFYKLVGLLARFMGKRIASAIISCPFNIIHTSTTNNIRVALMHILSNTTLQHLHCSTEFSRKAFDLWCLVASPDEKNSVHGKADSKYLISGFRTHLFLRWTFLRLFVYLQNLRCICKSENFWRLQFLHSWKTLPRLAAKNVPD